MRFSPLVKGGRGFSYKPNTISCFSKMEKNLPRILSEASNAIGVSLGEREIALFQEYYRELLFWNNKFNLVSVKSDIDIPIKHFIDSLTPLQFIEDKKSALLDIGTGAGFPGIPLKIAEDQLRITLTDSSRKKTSFLKNVVRKLRVDHATIVNRRVELLMKEEIYRAAYDVIISRASFKMSQFLKIGAFFTPPGGTLIAMKGANINEELKQAEETSQRVGWKHAGCHKIRLPIIGDIRNIVIYKKLRN